MMEDIMDNPVRELCESCRAHGDGVDHPDCGEGLNLKGWVVMCPAYQEKVELDASY